MYIDRGILANAYVSGMREGGKVDISQTDRTSTDTDHRS